MSTDCAIRAATSADIEHFDRIDGSTDGLFIEAGHPELANGSSIPRDIAQRAIEQGRILVAEVGEDVVGWMYLTRSDGELCIGQLAVHASFQKRGIGSALMDRVIAAAVDDREPTIVLNTQSDLPWNRPWYETFGFQVVPAGEWTSDMHVIVGEQTAEGLDWRTRVHMRLRLTGVTDGDGLDHAPGARAANDRDGAAG